MSAIIAVGGTAAVAGASSLGGSLAAGAAGTGAAAAGGSSFLSFLPGALSLGGAGAKAAGQIKGGQAASKADYYRAAIADRNAELQDQAADRVVQAGMVASDATGLKSAQTVGKIKVAQAANNVDVNTGSAVDVRAAAAKTGKLDQETVLSNTQLQGYGYRVRGASERANAMLLRAEAEDKKTGGAAAGVGTIAQSASALPFGWIQDKVKGGLPDFGSSGLPGADPAAAASGFVSDA